MAQRITTDKAHVYGPTSDASNSNEKRTSSGAVLKRLLPYLAPFRLQLSFAFVLVVVTALVQAAGPALIGQAIDFYIVGKDHNGLARTMLILLGIYEELTGIRVAQAYNRTEANIEHFAEHNAANRDVNVRAVAITSAFTPTIDLLSTLATAIVAGFGGWLAINHQIPVGTVVAFFLYVQQFFRPIQIISNIYTQVQSAVAGTERIFQQVDEPVEQKDVPGAQPLPPVVGRVVLYHVNFAYNADDAKPDFVLHDINLTVEPGQTIAFVGETGAGKSTLISLIPRFYDVTSGKVTIDGYNVHDVTLASLRKQIGLVQQDTYL